MIYTALIIAAIYYLIPLYIMLMTSLKGLEEVRLGNIFAPPVEITFEPWVKAWTSACTGLYCEGLKVGFFNSVFITVPSVIVSIAVGSVSGYGLANWRFKGSEIFFTILLVGSFIPYQVMIYPLVILTSKLGIYSTLYAVIMVHTIFGMPILTLLFRNYFASLPVELFKAARVDGAGFWGVFFRIMLPMSLPIFSVAIILQVTGIWNDFLFGLVFAGLQELSDDGAAQQHRQFDPGRARIQRQHGGDDHHRPRAAHHLFRVRQAVRARHRRGRREGLNRWQASPSASSGLPSAASRSCSDLDLEVAAGEFIVLLGASGCGKSTLLNAIAGLLDIEAGQILIGDKNVTWEEPANRGIGMVFQSYALYPRMTAEGNLTFGLKIARVPRDEIQRRVKFASELLQIESLLKRRPAQLSGGQRQRVAIGRALVRDVDVFLFDEPLSNLDAKLRTELRVELKRLHQQLGNRR